MEVISPLPIICPLNRCPPSSSPNFRARSTLTCEPDLSEPRVVLSSVSGIMSNDTVFPTEVAVRHTPSIDTEPPILRPSVEGISISMVTIELPVTDLT